MFHGFLRELEDQGVLKASSLPVTDEECLADFLPVPISDLDLSDQITECMVFPITWMSQEVSKWLVNGL